MYLSLRNPPAIHDLIAVPTEQYILVWLYHFEYKMIAGTTIFYQLNAFMSEMYTDPIFIFKDVFKKKRYIDYQIFSSIIQFTVVVSYVANGRPPLT